MGAEAVAVGPMSVWGTWEELILGGAVLRHGTRDWNVVASELRARSLYPHSFTPEVCKAKFEDLQKRYAGSAAWFEELRKQRMAELKRELTRSEDSIGSLESKIKSLEAERQNSNQADYDPPQTESPLPDLNSEGNESVCKEALKDDTSVGSFTKDMRIVCGHGCQETEMDVKPDVSVSSVLEKGVGMGKVAESGYGQGVTIRKKRGQRKRKGCHLAVKEGSAGESDNVCSSIVVSTVQKETSTTECDQTARDSQIGNHSGVASTVKRDKDLMDIFLSIASSEPAAVFRHRMDSQKRARYRKVIRQHLDIGTIRSRIVGQSIKTAKELFRDLLLLANNALVFYSRRTREYKSALTLRNLVTKEYKQHCSPLHIESTTPFLLPFRPPVKPRSARPRPHPHPRPQPCKDPALNKATPPIRETEAGCDSDSIVSLQKVKKGVKKVKPESTDDMQRRTAAVRPRKRVRK